MKGKARPVALIVGASLIAVLALLSGLGLLLPRHWHVRRSVLVAAPATVVHGIVEDLENWSTWAQWDRGAQSPQNQFGDRRRGTGASLDWVLTDRDGTALTTGRVTIARSEPARLVRFENQTGDGPPSTATLSFEPVRGVTEVTWDDRGELPPVVGGLFLDLYQTRLGRHVEHGLGLLKDLAEQDGLTDLPEGADRGRPRSDAGLPPPRPSAPPAQTWAE